MRWDHLFIFALMTISIAGLGMFVRLNHDNSRRGRWISRLTYGLTVGSAFSAGFVALLLGWPPGKEWLGMTIAGGGFGFCCGLWGGRFVWKHYRKEVEGEDWIE